MKQGGGGGMYVPGQNFKLGHFMFWGVGHFSVVTLYLSNLKLCHLLPFHQ